MSWLPKPYRYVSPDPDRLAIGGLVEAPNFGLRYDDLDQMPAEHQVDDAGAYASWAKVAGEPIRGIRIAALIDLAQVHPEALVVVARTHGGFSASVWKREIERLAIICYARGQEPLQSELGGPFRLLLPGFKDESRDLYDLATLEFATRKAPDSSNRRARIPRHSTEPGEIQGGFSRSVVDPAQARTIIAPPP